MNKLELELKINEYCLNCIYYQLKDELRKCFSPTETQPKLVITTNTDCVEWRKNEQS
jgi:hypothetical protein